MRKKEPVPVADKLHPWRIALWLVFFGGTMFFWPACLDRYLAPRFLFLSGALILAFALIWKDLKESGDWKLRGFDLLLLAWYGMNLASVSWAFSWSEGVFYAQKTLLLFLVYWFSRQAFLRDEGMLRQTLGQIVRLITWMVCAILVVQLWMALSKHGLDNEKLYAFASGLFGNKSLATEFLFFLLVLQVFFHRKQARRGDFWLAIGLLLGLILLLQTRTVYLALGLCAVLYGVGKAVMEPTFRQTFFKKIVPAAIVIVAGLAALIAFKGRGNSIAERLNPMTYMESISANERRFVWYKTGLLNQDHFWLGVGNGSWKFWFPSKSIDGGYRMAELNVVFTRVHNDYLEVQAEMGIIGLVLFCLLFGVAFWAIGRSLSRKRDSATSLDHRHDLLVLGLGLLGYCIIQFFDFPRERIEPQVMLAFLFAGIMFYTRDDFDKKIAIPGIAKPLLLGLIGLGLSFNLIIGWNRIQGEKHNVKLLEKQASKNWPALVQESIAAENTYYQYTDVGMPLSWHEGIGWYQQNKMDKAVAAFERAYQLNPWSFQVINNYASALVQNKQLKEAIPMFEAALKINPKFDDGKINLSIVCLELGEYAKALEWLDQVDTIPNPGTEVDRKSNALLKERQAASRKAIMSKMK